MKTIWIAAALLLSAPLMAETPFGADPFRSVGQQMTERALSEGIMLLRQEYQLEDTVTLKRYTWNGMPEFGSALSFCVPTSEGYLAQDRILQPWRGDSRFEAYRDSVFRPVLSGTLCRTVRDTVWRALGTSAPQESRPLADTTWRLVRDTLFHGGFAVDRSAGEKDGWLAWLTAAEGPLDSAALSLVVYRHKLTIAEDRDGYDIPAATTPNRLIGGIYVEPHYSGFGTITFALVGIVVAEGDGWRLLPIVRPPETPQAGALTPVETVEAPEAAAPGGEADKPDENARKRKKR